MQGVYVYKTINAFSWGRELASRDRQSAFLEILHHVQSKNLTEEIYTLG